MKTYKYSIYITFALLIFSFSAMISLNIIAIYNRIILEMFAGAVVTFIMSINEYNMEIYNNIILGVFTGAVATFIISITGYNIEKRRVIANIWNNCRKLNRDFYLLMLDYKELVNLEEVELISMIAQPDFNQKVREWENYYSSSFVTINMELDYIFKCSSKHKLVKNLQEDIARLSLVVDDFMNIYVNEKVGRQCIEIGITKFLLIIKKHDEDMLLDTIQKHLDELSKLLKEEKVVKS